MHTTGAGTTLQLVRPKTPLPTPKGGNVIATHHLKRKLVITICAVAALPRAEIERGASGVHGLLGSLGLAVSCVLYRIQRARQQTRQHVRGDAPVA